MHTDYSSEILRCANLETRGSPAVIFGPWPQHLCDTYPNLESDGYEVHHSLNLTAGPHQFTKTLECAMHCPSVQIVTLKPKAFNKLVPLIDLVLSADGRMMSATALGHCMAKINKKNTLLYLISLW